jgi:hypothetical protein
VVIHLVVDVFGRRLLHTFCFDVYALAALAAAPASFGAHQTNLETGTALPALRLLFKIIIVIKSDHVPAAGRGCRYSPPALQAQQQQC